MLLDNHLRIKSTAMFNYKGTIILKLVGLSFKLSKRSAQGLVYSLCNRNTTFRQT